MKYIIEFFKLRKMKLKYNRMQYFIGKIIKCKTILDAHTIEFEIHGDRTLHDKDKKRLVYLSVYKRIALRAGK